jgi:S-DNA-T family DNA segregation ATPase FtsK/SpoIIIE
LKQASQNKPERRPLAIQMGHRIREGILLVTVAVAVFLLVSFSTYHSVDPGWSSTGEGPKVLNWGGRAGSFLADVFLSIFGYIAFLFPLMLVFGAWVGAQPRGEDLPRKYIDLIFKCLGFLLIILSTCGLVTLCFKEFHPHLPTSAGGILGDVVGLSLIQVFNPKGAALFLFTAFLCGVTFFTGFSWLGLMDAIGWQVIKVFTFYRSEKRAELLSHAKAAIEPILTRMESKTKKLPAIVTPRVEPKVVVEAPRVQKQFKLSDKKLPSSVVIKDGMLPPYSLLDQPAPAEGKSFSTAKLEELSQLVEKRLLDFGVEVKVVAVHPGPVITRFELELAAGIKVSKISGLSKDIARSLSVSSVRIVEVIPGKAVIGLELPNEYREAVCLREILESARYEQTKSPVSLVLGKDIAGFPVVVDLAKMPHLLVAGTTGSGKSVSINAMILSMLFKATPEQLRLIFIDPKMLELSIYEGIPHLLTPVITDMKDAANALRWCVAEMDKRYKLMAAMGVRNLASYNQKIIDANKQGSPIPAPNWMADAAGQIPNLETLPVIVVVADELADMMMVVGKKVEDLIARIAQKARAAGIHLILATQRPSVDVITGLIKANIPTRISFQVSSRIDSRTILDQQGAEQLLGNGDMLYLPPGTGIPVRVHGAFVADEEVHRVVAAWQTYGKPVYLEEVTEGVEAAAAGGDGEGGELDPLYDQALKVVTETRRASISLVQRKLKIGYNRAATIMESMEAAGVVSSMDHSGSREVLAPPPVEA